MPGSVYSADAPSAKADEPADRQQAMAGDGQLEDEQDDGQPDEQQAADVERQAAEADEGQDDRERAQDAGHEVGVLELEDEAVEADREEDERDVRVGQQVQEAWNGFIEASSTAASGVSSVTGAPATSTTWPSMAASTAGRSVGDAVDEAELRPPRRPCRSWRRRPS